tara:strand:- start:170 stop:457 length:288 start_codon:yes stop_codon:yes gene_type:complete
VVAEFPTDWPEDAGTSWLPIFVDKNSCVLVEADIASIRAPPFFTSSNNYAANDFTFFDSCARDSIFDRRDENITNRGVATPGASKNADAQHFSGA